MKTLWAILVIISMAFASCKSTNKKDLGPQGTFEIQRVKKDSVRNKGITIHFNAENGQINGKAVCNSYSSTYVVSGTNIKFSPAASTKMMCPEGTTLEYNFFQALLNAGSFSLKRNQLTLFNASDEVLLVAKKQ